MNKIKSLKKKTTHGSLFLQGVFKKDCKKLEDIFTERLMLEETDENTIIVYDKMPPIFNSVKTWPKTTNILCWYCNRSFETFPWFKPRSIDPISKGVPGKFATCEEVKKTHNSKLYAIVPEGTYCSSNCVMADILREKQQLSSLIDKINMLKLLYSIVNGVVVDEIYPSPSPTIMCQYGGELSEARYQLAINKLDAKSRE